MRDMIDWVAKAIAGNMKNLGRRGTSDDENLEDFDSEKFIRKAKGEPIERITRLDGKYKATQLSLMLKTLLVSVEILAERLNAAKGDE